MVQAELTVENPEGIHLGPANKITNVAGQFKSEIHLKTEYMDMNAKSIISVVSATFRRGDKVLCVCQGPDEEEALKAMKQIMSQNLEDD
ncbi:MAG: HPr family phosphocarrier protein [Eubacterium sp.]|nr:HPr family phosphocarrier protein [Eubacterium sp.]